MLMTLRGAARLYWNSMEEQLYQFGRLPVTLWNEMKFKLREQYVPTFYLEQLFDQLWTISQGNLTVTEFHARFIKQKKRAGIHEEPGITVSRFIHGLHDDIKHEVCRFDPHCLEDADCHALEAEAYLQPQHSGYSGQPATANQTLPTTGSRSMFETLRLGKPLILVVNEDLMDSHQSELAEELAERKHLYYARPQTLCRTIANMNLDYLIPYPGDGTPVAKLINRFLGFSDD
ncbi:uncharacterized protein LOC117629372 [Prunus dulcis]|nr:uncharacterized protein LOC117629372 [Prunus dulcis]XP_034217822.1 uncharacterized protein LOC117629372 [Prunus dulcis]XP_034217823.1 uncharacterized protein LOC117629372 [Prunus dulcis]XP_034217824.1 uncharacterized protein LOC117629372 [Prunus dulcis]